MFRSLLVLSVSLSSAVAFADIPLPPAPPAPVPYILSAEIRTDSAIIARRHSGIVSPFLGGVVTVSVPSSEITLVGKVDCPPTALCMPAMLNFRLTGISQGEMGMMIYTGEAIDYIETFPNQVSKMTIQITDYSALMNSPWPGYIGGVTEIGITTQEVGGRVSVPVTSTLFATELK